MWCFNHNIVNLSDVVSMIPENTTEINLSKNKIGVIPAGSFSRLTGLKKLDLSQNMLVSLKGGEFRGANLLEFLNLTCNNISHITSNVFEGLTMLQTLLLTHNALAGILPAIFNFLPAIQEVSLSLNSLSSFSCAESGSSTTLKHLDLWANRIRTLNVSCYPALEYIRLSNNTRLELQSEAFAFNPRLTTLLLQGVEAKQLLGLSAQTKRNLTWVSFSLFVEKSPLTICGLLRGMDHLETVEVCVLRLT